MADAQQVKRPHLLVLSAFLAGAGVLALLLAILGVVGPYLFFMPDDIDPVDRPPKLNPILVYVGLAIGFAYGAWSSFRAAKRNGPPAT